jgi:hypothetical protein
MRLAVTMAALVAALLAPAGARADLLAAVDVTGPDGSADVGVLNASTGTRVALPAGINTAAQERHPSITIDGKQLVFLRSDPAAGTIRVIFADLTNGESADLFTGFEVAQRPPSDPAILPTGGDVFTGAPFGREQSTFFADLIHTFRGPSGSFTHSTLRPPYGFAVDGRTTQPTAGGHLRAAYALQRGGTRSEVVLGGTGTLASPPLGRADRSYSHPALAGDVGPTQLLFVDRPFSKGDQGTGDIVFRPAIPSTFPGTPTALPAIVNSGDESLPAFSPDERYVAFVRRTGGHDRLFAWDSQTQTLLNPSGVDLGTLAAGESGNLSLYTRALFTVAVVAPTGLVTANLLQNSVVGLFVQRIVGRKKVLGRRAFKLRTVGRVPLGKFKRGHLRKRWDFKVGGKRLRPGRYLVTVRGVTPKRVVRELGKPKVIRIRRR